VPNVPSDASLEALLQSALIGWHLLGGLHSRHRRQKLANAPALEVELNCHP
jgi:hypothetical protein